MGEAKRKEQFRTEPRPCIFCGRPATTRDHVPPKGIFLKPCPQLITVPACKSCNGGSSELDEQFKVFLSLQVGTPTEATTELWKNGALRSIQKNNKLLQELLSGSRTASGLTFKWPAPAHNKTIEKITRGLYYHNFKVALPLDTKIQTYFLHPMNEQLRKLAMSMPRKNIGGDHCFVYAFDRVADNPVLSLWMYQFYNGHWAGAVTTPASHVWPLA